MVEEALSPRHPDAGRIRLRLASLLAKSDETTVAIRKAALAIEVLAEHLDPANPELAEAHELLDSLQSGGV